MVLWYLKSVGRMYILCSRLGLVPSSIPTRVDYALTVLNRVCNRKRYEDLRVQCPGKEEIEALAQLLKKNTAKRNVMIGVFAVLYGSRLPCTDYTEDDVLNAYYERNIQSL